MMCPGVYITVRWARCAQHSTMCSGVHNTVRCTQVCTTRYDGPVCTTQYDVPRCAQHSMMGPGVHNTVRCAQIYTTQYDGPRCVQHSMMGPGVHKYTLLQAWMGACYYIQDLHFWKFSHLRSVFPHKRARLDYWKKFQKKSAHCKKNWQLSQSRNCSC
jgi:hypothetical protein